MKQEECLFVLLIQDLSNIPSIGEVNGVWIQDPDTVITRSLGIYREWSVGNGVEHDNDISYRVVTRRDRSLLVMGVRDHIGRGFHIAEHRLSGLNNTIIQIIKGGLNLFRLIHSNVPFVTDPCMSI